MRRIVVLGWGSLIWEPGSYAKQVHGEWMLGGPTLPIEFSRVSTSRLDALTLVIDPVNGDEVATQFIVSNRDDPNDAACDLRNREGTIIKNIGLIDLESGVERGGEDIRPIIRAWAEQRDVKGVVWTDLRSNFRDRKQIPFSIESAIGHLQALTNVGIGKAKEYITNAPPEMDTYLRRALADNDWWQSLNAMVRTELSSDSGIIPQIFKLRMIYDRCLL